MRRRESERGSTILEYLIAAVVTAILLIAAVAGIAKFTRATAASREVSDFEEGRAAVADITRTDLDGAGRNLTRPQAPGAGTEQAAFPTSTDYSSSSGTLTKTGATGWSTTTNMTRGLASGIGSFSLTPPANGAAAWIYGSDGSTFGIIVGFGSWMAVYENWTEVASTCCRSPQETITPHIAGDVYKFSVDLESTSPPSSVVRLYRTRASVTTLLWSSARPVPSYPLGLGTQIFNQYDTISNVSVTGAPIISLSGGSTEYSLMPLDRGTRLPRPVTVTNGGQSITVLSGDTATDIAYTAAAFVSNTSGGTLSLKLPRRGSLLVGDILDVIDFPAGRACLYRIEQVNATSSISTLVLRPVFSSQPAWGRLSSDANDSQYTFPQGAAVVKLSPPVTYNVTADNRLVRMEGNRVTTAAFNVRSFTVTEQIISTGRSYSLSLTLAAEGYETDSNASTESRSNIEYTSVPRSLNLTANELN
jgi:hypothetical protein